MNYVESIDWLFSTQMFGIKLGLDGPRRLLKEYLAHPAHGVTVIHVAGTNGKGSTCAMIDSIARSSGKRTGLFTSPHLIDYRERIKVSGVEIPEEDCASGLTELRAICERLDHHPTFFEITLALAMRWFRERECEVIVLETGMGGRLDATTAVQADIAVITPIGLDHTQWLGDTLELVAAEKAGIFVPGKPAVSSPQEPAAQAVLEKEANESRSPLEFVTGPLLGYGVALPGEHQKWNAALAVAALFKCGLQLNSDIIRHGLAHLSWPGRFERFEVDGSTVILDGAHNSHAAKVLAHTWESEFGDRKAALVFSAVSLKDIAGILQSIAPLASEIFICPVATPRTASVEEIAVALPDGSAPHRLFPDFSSAFAAAKTKAGPILVSGSLFLVGEARALLTDRRFQASTQ